MTPRPMSNHLAVSMDTVITLARSAVGAEAHSPDDAKRMVDAINEVATHFLCVIADHIHRTVQ